MICTKKEYQLASGVSLFCIEVRSLIESVTPVHILIDVVAYYASVYRNRNPNPFKALHQSRKPAWACLIIITFQDISLAMLSLYIPL